MIKLKFKNYVNIRHILGVSSERIIQYYSFNKDLYLHNHEYFFKGFCMSLTNFVLLLSCVEAQIRRSSLLPVETTPFE